MTNYANERGYALCTNGREGRHLSMPVLPTRASVQHNDAECNSALIRTSLVENTRGLLSKSHVGEVQKNFRSCASRRSRALRRLCARLHAIPSRPSVRRAVLQGSRTWPGLRPCVGLPLNGRKDAVPAYHRVWLCLTGRVPSAHGRFNNQS